MTEDFSDLRNRVCCQRQLYLRLSSCNLPMTVLHLLSIYMQSAWGLLIYLRTGLSSTWPYESKMHGVWADSVISSRLTTAFSSYVHIFQLMKPSDWNTKILHIPFVGRQIAVCLAAGYGLDGLGIESLLGRHFCNRPDRLWVPPSYLYNG